jgi:hypothetical protein
MFGSRSSALLVSVTCFDQRRTPAAALCRPSALLPGLPALRALDRLTFDGAELFIRAMRSFLSPQEATSMDGTEDRKDHAIDIVQAPFARAARLEEEVRFLLPLDPTKPEVRPMSEHKPEASPQSQPSKPQRQVTVQPQEPVPGKGGPPKQPAHPDKKPRPVPAGGKDKRSNQDRDGLD